MEILNKIDTYTTVFGPSTITIIGIIGNSISLFILTRPNFKKEPTFRYFIMIVSIGTLSLANLWVQFIPLILKWELPAELCKSFVYFAYVGYNVYPWVHVLNSVDRLAFVKYPQKFKKFRTVKFQVTGLIFLYAIFCFTSIPYILFEVPSNQTVCTLINQSAGFYLSLQNLILSDLIPFCIMLLCTIISFHHLIKTKSQVSSVNENNNNRENRFLKSVLVMDIWFLVFYLPYSLITFLTYADIFDEKHQVWGFFII